MNDQAHAANASYALTGSSLTRAGAALLTYSGFNNGAFINGGSGNTSFTVSDTPLFATTLNSGTGPNTVTVRATSGPFAINGQNGNDTVRIGDLGIGGSVQQILGAVTVSNASGSTALTVTDTLTQFAKTVTQTAVGLTGLAPAPIHWAFGDLSSLAVYGGTAPTRTPSPARPPARARP